MSLHHFDANELPLVLRDIRRVLRKGGYFFIREVDGEQEMDISCPCKKEKKEESEIIRLARIQRKELYVKEQKEWEL